MKHTRINVQRRDVLKMGSIALVSAVIGARAGKSQAQGAQPHVSEKDPQAQGLGYKDDARKVDKKKFATYKAGETCSNCNFFQGKPGDAWGSCTIFAGKQVNAKGWCSAYVKKA